MTIKNENTADCVFVSVIVPTFRRLDALSRTLEALMGLSYPKHSYEVIVVDDGSGDMTPEVVAAKRQDLPHLSYHSQPNSGVATARNHGARLARGEILIFVDDDIIVPANLIELHLKTMAEFGDCIVNGHWELAPELMEALRQSPFGRFRIEVEKWVKEGVRMKPLGGNYHEPTGVTACNMAIRREGFWSLGGFDEQFPFAGCEDQEFSIRAAAAGYRFVYNYDLQFWHNDHRLTLEQFCERQRRGAITAALLAVKHPRARAHQPLILENCPIRTGDSFTIVAKKMIKSLFATRPVMSVLLSAIRVIERAWSNSPWLAHVYWAMFGLYIFRGVREGLFRYSGDKHLLAQKPRPDLTAKPKVVQQ